MATSSTSILIIYTGGTIGMKENPETGALAPFNFNQILNEVPELRKFGFNLDTISFNPLVDSSDITPDFWVRLAGIVQKNYHKYNGFVVLHGTDTMSYSASALSFMLENLSKPVVFTGSQLPIGKLRTDGKENLISAIEVAAATSNGQPLVPEVTIFFENQLFRGNRTTKHNSEHFNAFRSDNYPVLAQAGISINYNFAYIYYPTHKYDLVVHKHFNTSVAILTLFPGITPAAVDSVFATPGVRAVILHTFGSGNGPSASWFIKRVKLAVDRGILVFNVTQCKAGGVDMDKYDNGLLLKKAGVVSGNDITIEAAVVKLMFILGQDITSQELRVKVQESISGEISC
ncbi:MAG: type I asparaginase [Bacteroidales bacterium]|nr:type I asparaginase [Bacteroidales bacterium]